MSGVIHKKDLDRLMYWLTNVLGSPCGDVFFVSSAASAWETWFKRIGVDSDHRAATPAAGYALMTTGRNDTLLVAPEVYTTTAELDWSKSNCHFVGLGGPNIQGRKAASGTSPTMPGGACLYTTTAGVVSTLHVTGARNQFHNMQLVNAGANATNLRALHLGACGASSNSGYGNHFKNCNFQGIMDATYHTTIPHASVTIGSGSSYYKFEDCIIGQNTYGGARATAYQGHLNYEGVYATDGAQAAGYGPQNGIFNRCMFLTRGTTTTPVMVRVGGGSGAPTGDEAMDRVHWFIDCVFDNWYGAGTTSMTSAFDDNCLSWHEVRIVNSAIFGFDQWRAVRASQNASGLGLYFTNMAAATAAHAGEGVEPTS